MKIYKIEDKISISKINLGDLQVLQGGTSHYVKLLLDNDKIYVQLPECYMKNGIMNTKRGKYCDLLYNESHEIMSWIVKIEKIIIQLINLKKNEWFQNSITKEDIYNMLNPCYRKVKSSLLIRVYIDVSKSGVDNCLLYNEDGENENLTNVNSEYEIIPLIHLDGIKINSKSFEISFKLIQIMKLKKKEKEKISCLIDYYNRNKNINNLDKKSLNIDKIINDDDDDNDYNSDNSESCNNNKIIDKNINNSDQGYGEEQYEDQYEEDDEDQYEEDDEDQYEEHDEDKYDDKQENQCENKQEDQCENKQEDQYEEDEEEHQYQSEEKSKEQFQKKNDSTKIDNSNKTDNIKINNNDIENLKEINLKDLEEINLNDLEKTDNIDLSKNKINLKDRTNIYEEIYKKARLKAKELRKASLKAYLEAENIKNQYFIEDINSDDSEDE